MKPDFLKQSLRTAAMGAAAILLLAPAQEAAASMCRMVLEKTDGTTIEVGLSASLSTYVEESVLHFSDTGLDLAIPLSEVKGWGYDSNPVASTPDITADSDGLTADTDGTILTLRGADPGSLARLCDSAGRVLRSARCDADGQAIIRLSGLTSGIYIVAVNDSHSLKIAVTR